MRLLLLLGLLSACAAVPQDLTGKVFTFPQSSTSSYVRLTASHTQFAKATLCQRFMTDLRRDHGLFSLSTRTFPNGFLIFWDEPNKEMEVHIRDKKAEYYKTDIKLNMWHSLCATWESSNGLVQLWLDGLPSIRKYVAWGTNFTESQLIIILGQEQDSHGGSFDSKQCFIGMMADVHMWDYVLSPCEIQAYVDDRNFTPGNMLNWKALEFQIFDKVLIEDKQMSCH
ncbi:C-reactive protein-like [Synchiropus picturatus]